MGISFSHMSTEESETQIFSESVEMAGNSYDNNTSDINEDEFYETSEGQVTRDREQEMLEFKKQLAVKREQRREIIAKHREEKEILKKTLNIEIQAKEITLEENKKLKEILKQHNIAYDDIEINNEEDTNIMTIVKKLQEELEVFKENNKILRKELAESNLSLQSANSDIANLNFQNIESMKHIKALKEVVTVSKTMIGLREQQLHEVNT